MHVIAILANLILLIVVVALIAGNGLPDSSEGLGTVVAAIVSPVLSTIALLRRNGSISELVSLEIRARKATLRRRIAEAEATAVGSGING